MAERLTFNLPFHSERMPARLAIKRAGYDPDETYLPEEADPDRPARWSLMLVREEEGGPSDPPSE